MASSIVGTLRAILTLDAAEFEKGIRKGQSSLQVFSRDMKTMGTQATQIGSSLMRTVTLPILAAGGAVAAAAIKFESSFAGIAKTVDGVSDSTGKLTAVGRALAQDFRNLAKELPVNVNELNKIGEAAGQLGIKRENIVGFTAVMAKLGVATNLTGEEAATMLARFDNITTGGAQETFEELGSTIVGLGNNLATTEQEILQMGMKLAGAGAQIGLTQAEILGLGGALSSLGLEAEAGGTAFSRVMIEMQNAVMDGGKSLDLFREVAGDTFRETFQRDAAQGINDFIGGLARMSEEGRNINPVLDKLGLGAVRVSDALRRTGNAVERVTGAVQLARDEFSRNTALTEEATKRFATTAEQLKLLGNRIADVGITLGNALLPMIRASIKAFDALVPWLEAAANIFTSMPMPVQAIGVALGLAAAAAGPLIFIFGQLALSASAVAGAFTAKGIATRGLNAAMLTLGTTARLTWVAILGPVGAIAAIGAGLAMVAERAKEGSASFNLLKTIGLGIASQYNVVGQSAQKAATDIALLAENTITLDEALQRTGMIAGTTVDEITRLEEEAAAAARAAAALTDEQKELTKALSGAGLLQTARNYEIAVRSIGGASRLTGEEKKKYAEVLDVVIEKYRLLGSAGASVVAHFTQLRDATLIPARMNLEAVGLAMDRSVVPNTIAMTRAMRESWNVMNGLTTSGLIPASQNTKVLAASMAGAGTVTWDMSKALQAVGQNAKAAGSMFGSFKAGLSEGWSNVLKGLTGGQGIGGFLSKLGGGIVEGFGNLISGGISSLISKGIGFATKGLSMLFGSPSQRELEGREAAMDFRKGLEKGLTAGQRAEAVASGNFQWASSVIAIRDAYIAAGRTEAEALAAADRLWRAEKKGGDAVKRVQEEINAVMEQGQAIRENATAFASELPGLLDEVAASGQLVSAELRTIIDRVRETGEVTGDIRDFITGQTKTAATGLAGFLNVGAEALDTLGEKRQELADLESQLADASENGQEKIRESIQKVTDEIKAQERIVRATSVTTAASAQAFAAGIFGSFTELRRQGLNVIEALDAVKPAVSALETHLQAAGLSGGAAFESLLNLVRLSEDEIAGPALSAVGSLNEALIGLHNAALLDQETFSGLASQVSQTFDELVRQGKDGDDALRLMQPTLQTIWQLQTDFGFAVDESTQKMLDQAATAGIVGEAHRSAEERIARGIERLIGLMEDFIRAMGVDLPNAAEDAVSAIGGVEGALESIPSEVPDPFRNWSAPDIPNVSSFTDGYGQEFHQGGMITAHMGRFLGPKLQPGEVMVKALAGEGILSHAGMRNLGGPGMLEGLNSGTVSLDPAAGMASAMAGLFDRPATVSAGTGTGAQGGGESSVVQFNGGIHVRVEGAGKNADQIAAEIAPKILREIDRYNPAGARTHFKRMVRQAQAAPA